MINSLSTGGAETSLVRLVGAADASRYDHIVLPLRGDGTVTARVGDTGALMEVLGIDGTRNVLTAPVRLAARVRGVSCAAYGARSPHALAGLRSAMFGP